MFESLIVAVIVLWSVYVVFKKVFPTRYIRTFLALSQFCHQRGYKTLAKWLRPPLVMGCGGGCGCKEDKPSNSPVKWR